MKKLLIILSIALISTFALSGVVLAENVTVPVTPTPIAKAPAATAPTPAPAKSTAPVASGQDSVKANLDVPEALDIKPVSMEEFQAHVMKKMAEIIVAIRKVATPYMYFSFMIGAFILILPFQTPMKKYAGWTTIFTTLVAYLLIYYGQVIMGVVRGFAQD